MVALPGRLVIVSSETILVIDDEPAVLSLIEYTLARSGWQVYTALNGIEGLEQFSVRQPDLVILDLIMPGMDGWETCRRIRQLSCVPIMMLTALKETSCIVRGLKESGADDYLIKPFNADILAVRVLALLRRAALSISVKEPVSYDDGYLSINLAERQILIEEQPIKLTATEYRLLIYLFQNANRVLSSDHILESVWGPRYQDSTDYVHVYISRLRQKIEADPKNPHYLITQHGVGYRFQKPTSLIKFPVGTALLELAIF